jgi:hypothetical protein
MGPSRDSKEADLGMPPSRRFVDITKILSGLQPAVAAVDRSIGGGGRAAPAAGSSGGNTGELQSQIRCVQFAWTADYTMQLLTIMVSTGLWP